MAARVVLTIAGAALAFRVFSALVALLTNIVFPDYQREQFTVFGSTSPFWDALARYDSGWYYQIARYGYEGGAGGYVPGGRSSIGFFPAYPLLMRFVGRAIGRTPADFYIGGLIVSWAAFVAAMIGVYALARLDLPPKRAERATLLAAVFPFAFFFGAVYSEALFLASAVGCFYFFRTKRWILGGVCGALATATRVNGILMWPALAWIVWRQLTAGSTGPGLRDGDAAGSGPGLQDGGAAAGSTGPGLRAGPGRRDGRGIDGAAAEQTAGSTDRWWAIAGLTLVPVGIGMYSLYIYGLSGNPLEWAATIQRWGYYPGGSPVSVFWRLGTALAIHPYAFLASERLAPYDSLNGVAAFAALVAVPFVWRRLGAAYGLFMAANLWLPLSTGQVEGMGRYVAVMFPLFIWLASIASSRAFIVAAVVFAMLYTLCLALFTNIHPLF